MTNPTTVLSVIPRLAPRPPDAHKGTLVQVAVPEPIAVIVASGNPCYMTTPSPADAQGRLARIAVPLLLEQASSSTAVVVGPGLGQTEDVRLVVQTLIEEVSQPLLLDADALNVLGANPKVLEQRKKPFVITPHPGEFARLIGQETAAVQANRQELGVNFARTFGGVVVLKGAHTVVTDGQQVYTNSTGNPGMATGGSGDVLSGVIGALLASRMEAIAAAVLGVYLHGLAGDLARDEKGETALIATDLVDYLPRAFQKHAANAEAASNQD
jgi:ADP-dependent NAD(P)H-hydrate dehydratase